MTFPIGKLLFMDPTAFGARRQRMVSTWRLRGPVNEADTVFDRFFNKCVQLKSGENLTLLEEDGPGIIVRVYFTLPTRFLRGILRTLAVHIEVDGVRTFSSPLGDMFALPFGRYRTFSAFYVSCLSGGYALRFPIPFSKHIRISLTNDDSRTAPFVFFQANLFECDELPDNTPTLCGHWKRTNPTRHGEPHNILDVDGCGWYTGCHLNAQMTEPYTRPPVRRIVFPFGYGLGNLEGWERIYVDGEDRPSFHGTGHEEFFDAGWYFTRSYDVGPFAGVLGRSYVTGRTSVFRHHPTDPIPFHKSLRIDLDHGIDNIVQGDYSSLALFYADPPFPGAPDLPDGQARLPGATGPHAMRFLASLPLMPWALARRAPGFLDFLKRNDYDLRKLLK